jgi:hypothetical protein
MYEAAERQLLFWNLDLGGLNGFWRKWHQHAYVSFIVSIDHFLRSKKNAQFSILNVQYSSKGQLLQF